MVDLAKANHRQRNTYHDKKYYYQLNKQNAGGACGAQHLAMPRPRRHSHGSNLPMLPNPDLVAQVSLKPSSRLQLNAIARCTAVRMGMSNQTDFKSLIIINQEKWGTMAQ